MTDITELAQSHELRNKVNHRLYGALEFQGTSGENATITLSIDECKSIIAAMDERIALVEALEKAQGMEAYWKTQCRGITDHCEELQARIAELESRTVTAAAADVLAERQRQVTAEGWTAERDDGYQNSELADAAACYAIHAHNQGFSTPAHWPWSQDWWKQTSPRRDLVKAGALILAEIERLDRAAGIKVEAE
ncbi:ead/Ea22-like family protein [Raoultella ornithinolytica]|uniref:ead/Ea22-like family protein n=1 Tax=Raoultella ornithinolytica TaxID=54291 RepID=UPI001EF77907|nr:ead/Ea22-like family protein [Raoultella ornithinolytica]